MLFDFWLLCCETLTKVILAVSLSTSHWILIIWSSKLSFLFKLPWVPYLSLIIVSALTQVLHLKVLCSVQSKRNSFHCEKWPPFSFIAYNENGWFNYWEAQLITSAISNILNFQQTSQQLAKDYRLYLQRNYLNSPIIPTRYKFFNIFQQQRDLLFFHWQYALQQQPMPFYNTIEGVSGIPWIAIMQTDLKSFCCVYLRNARQMFCSKNESHQKEPRRLRMTKRETQREKKRAREGQRNRIDRNTQRWMHLQQSRIKRCFCTTGETQDIVCIVFFLA